MGVAGAEDMAIRPDQHRGHAEVVEPCRNGDRERRKVRRVEIKDPDEVIGRQQAADQDSVPAQHSI